MNYTTWSLLAAALISTIMLGCESTTSTVEPKGGDGGGTKVDNAMMGWPYESYNEVVQTFPDEIKEDWPLVWNSCGMASCHKGVKTRAFEHVYEDSDHDLFFFESLVEEMAAEEGSSILNAEQPKIAAFLHYASQNGWPQDPPASE